MHVFCPYLWNTTFTTRVKTRDRKSLPLSRRIGGNRLNILWVWIFVITENIFLCDKRKRRGWNSTDDRHFLGDRSFLTQIPLYYQPSFS
uniref:Uncharacterized protein n=1 Tax=Anguilla anguilla TaxID=7936 RepID=A0A0E9R8F5_ANGAN